MDSVTSVWPQTRSLSTPHGIFVAGAPRNDDGQRGKPQIARSPPLLLPHQAPFGDHGLAHLARIAGAGDLVDLDRDLLPTNAFNCPACASLEVTSWKVSGPVSRLHSPLGGGRRRGSEVIW